MGKSKLRLGYSISISEDKQTCVNSFLKIEWKFYRGPSGNRKEKGQNTLAIWCQQRAHALLSKPVCFYHLPYSQIWLAEKASYAVYTTANDLTSTLLCLF